MKKTEVLKRFCAFSLAEALITLLIVCLITLASVPVITKKKRNVNDSSASGTWMCSINSNGEYVVYDSSKATAEMDKNKPDSWTSLGTTEGPCTFVPPLNAKNFVLTLIGGGGGGRDGYTVLEEYINGYTTNERYFVTKETEGRFAMAIAGGGGGGHGSDDVDENESEWGTDKKRVGVGGQGGAGAQWYGYINLQEGDAITTTRGTGHIGATDGGAENKQAHSPNLAENSSSIYINDKLFVTAGGGGGGFSTNWHTGKSDPVEGGKGGTGGTLTWGGKTGRYYTTIHKKSGDEIKGRDNMKCSKTNYCDRESSDDVTHVQLGNFHLYGKENGMSLSSFSGGLMNQVFGSGGFGAAALKLENNAWTWQKDTTGQTGGDGTVKLWQAIQQAGEGGKASDLAIFPIASMKNKLEITIGKGGEKNNDGTQTIAKVINSKNEVLRQYRSFVGKAGEYMEKIVGFDKVIYGSEGGDSFWTNDGGGKITDTCHAAYTDYEETYVTEEVIIRNNQGEPMCDYAVYDLGATTGGVTSSTTTNKCQINKTNTDALGAGYCIGYNNPSTSGQMQTVYNNILEYCGIMIGLGLNHRGTCEITGLPAITGYTINNKSDFLKYSSKGFKNWQNAERSDYYCMQYKTKTESIPKKTEVFHPATCNRADNGKYFGAGGGGGSSVNVSGVFGEGGNGAPGAVIIEW